MPQMPRAGDLLISPANIIDPRFANTVMLLTHQTDEGSYALCMNRPLPHSVDDIISDIVDFIPNFNFPVYWGGPVNPGTMWMVHDSEWNIGNRTMRINEHWSITSHISMFHHMMDGDYPNYFRLCMGLASWAPGQLEKEIEGERPWRKEHSWLIASLPDPMWIIDTEERAMWHAAVELSAGQAVSEWL